MKRISEKTLKLTQVAVFTAIIAVMAFTPIGYFKTAVVSITLIPIPVAIGAITLGPAAGAILGGVFGFTSFIQCFGLDAFGTALASTNVFFTFLMCFIPRILMGFVTGYIFRWINKIDKTKVKLAPYLVASLVCPIVNTVLFMSLLVLFFGKSDYILGLQETLGTDSVMAFIVAMVGVNGIVETVTTCILGTAIAKPLDKIVKKNIY